MKYKQNHSLDLEPTFSQSVGSDQLGRPVKTSKRRFAVAMFFVSLGQGAAATIAVLFFTRISGAPLPTFGIVSTVAAVVGLGTGTWLALWLETFLDQKGFSTKRGTYSKLSFLRDTVNSDERLLERYV